MWIALAIAAAVGLALYSKRGVRVAPPPPGKLSPHFSSLNLNVAKDVRLEAGAIRGTGGRIVPAGVAATNKSDDTAGREVAGAAPVVLALLASIVGGALAFVALAILEIEFFVNAFSADQDLLHHGRQGALDDFTSLACNVRDNIRPAFLQAGATASQATALAMLYGWNAAVGGNAAAEAWVRANGTGWVGVTESQVDHMNHWADRAMYVAEQAVSDTTLAPSDPHTVSPFPSIPSFKQNSAGYDAGQSIFNDPAINSYQAALSTAGTTWANDVQQMALDTGAALWGCKGLFAGYDDQFLSGDPSITATHWNILGKGDAGAQAGWFYTDGGYVQGSFNPSTAVVTFPSGVLWLCDQTYSQGKPILSFVGT